MNTLTMTMTTILLASVLFLMIRPVLSILYLQQQTSIRSVVRLLPHSEDTAVSSSFLELAQSATLVVPMIILQQVKKCASNHSHYYLKESYNFMASSHRILHILLQPTPPNLLHITTKALFNHGRMENSLHHLILTLAEVPPFCATTIISQQKDLP